MRKEIKDAAGSRTTNELMKSLDTPTRAAIKKTSAKEKPALKKAVDTPMRKEIKAAAGSRTTNDLKKSLNTPIRKAIKGGVTLKRKRQSHNEVRSHI